MKVFVLNRRGKPLMPCSAAKARVLLKAGKASVRYRTPFTIQLKYATGETVQPVSLGVDAGAKTIGLSATTKKEELFASEVTLRSDVTELVSTRRECRRARRNRKTRYRASRFDNRVRSKRKGWLAPSIENRINAHLSRIEAVCGILPVSKITVETASFDIQRIKNPDIEGKGYQQGDQLGFWNVREYVLFRDGHVCQQCKGKSKDNVLNVHHIESRKRGGDAPNNLIVLCETCHKAYHRGEIELKIKRGKRFDAETFMGVMRWTLLERLKARFTDKEVKNTYGYNTKHARIVHGIEKTHRADAFCIAGNFTAKRLESYFAQKQTRKHNRQIHKLTILKGGIRKRNQAPYEVKGFRLFDKVFCQGEEGFIYGRRSSGYFDIRTLDGIRIAASANWKKLHLLEPKKTFLTQLRGESLPPPAEAGGLRAEL